MKKHILTLFLSSVTLVSVAQTTQVEVSPLEHLDKLEHEIEFRTAADEVFSRLKEAQEGYEAEKKLRYQRFEQCQQVLCQLEVAKALINNEINYSEALELVTGDLRQIRDHQLGKAKSALQIELKEMQQHIHLKSQEFITAWQRISAAFHFSTESQNNGFNKTDLSPEQQAELTNLGLELIAQKYEIESLFQQQELINADIEDYSLVDNSIAALSLQIDTRAKTHSTEARKLAARTELVARVGSSNDHNQQLHNMMGRFAGYSASNGIDNSILGQLGGMLTGERKTVGTILQSDAGESFDLSMFEEISSFVKKLSTASLPSDNAEIQTSTQESK